MAPNHPEVYYLGSPHITLKKNAVERSMKAQPDKELSRPILEQIKRIPGAW